MVGYYKSNKSFSEKKAIHYEVLSRLIKSPYKIDNFFKDALHSVTEKICPIRIFFVKQSFFFFREIMRIIFKKE